MSNTSDSYWEMTAKRNALNLADAAGRERDLRIEVELLREAISLAVCNSCESNLTDNDWVVVDYTERYNPLAAPDQRPGWMRDRGIWENEQKALLCAWCAASDNSGSSPRLSEYRNHRGPGLRLLDPDLRLLNPDD